jgi:hypothetical protein
VVEERADDRDSAVCVCRNNFGEMLERGPVLFKGYLLLLFPSVEGFSATAPGGAQQQQVMLGCYAVEPVRDRAAPCPLSRVKQTSGEGAPDMVVRGA